MIRTSHQFFIFDGKQQAEGKFISAVLITENLIYFYEQIVLVSSVFWEESEVSNAIEL